MTTRCYSLSSGLTNGVDKEGIEANASQVGGTDHPGLAICIFLYIWALISNSPLEHLVLLTVHIFSRGKAKRIATIESRGGLKRHQSVDTE
jgi:hypothetical protein